MDNANSNLSMVASCRGWLRYCPLEASQMLILFLIATVLLTGLPVSAKSERFVSVTKPETVKVVDLDVENERDLESTAKELVHNTSFNGGEQSDLDAPGQAKYKVIQIEYRSVAARRSIFTDSKRSRIKGVTILTTIDRFADVFVPVRNSRALARLLNDANILRWELARTVTAPPPPSLTSPPYTTKGIAETILRNGYTDSRGKRLSGKNVLLAVIDTGVDFTHPDFVDYDEDGNPASRFEYFLDTTLEFRAGRGGRSPFSYPNKTPIGTLFYQTHLTDALRLMEKGEPSPIPCTDEDGHGTACASIAAGNGNADQSASGLKRDDVVGVAPDAELIGIRISRRSAILENAYLLNAICEWLDKVAGDRPLVISSSFGGSYTGHDGQSVNERELNARFESGERKGRTMLVSAGNESRRSIHARVTFGNSDKAGFVSWQATEPTTINLFFNTSVAKNLKFIGVGGTNLDKNRLRWELNRITNEVQATLEVEQGTGQIRLFNNAGEPTEVHLYFARIKAGRFIAGAENRYLITAPGSARDLITVGSYDFNDSFHRAGKLVLLNSPCLTDKNAQLTVEIGVLSCYSSPGPTRDRRYKPDLIAPGQWYTASYARGAHNWTVDTTGRYAAMNGTSAATPYVAGVVALMFEAQPDLTTNQIKQIFTSNLTVSGLKPGSNEFPNGEWGNGKLDISAIERILESLSNPATR